MEKSEMHADCVVLCALTAILIRWTIGEHDQGDVAISRNVTQQSTSTSQSAHTAVEANAGRTAASCMRGLN